MSFERTSPFMYAPQNDEGHEHDDDFPAGVQIVSLEALVKGIEAAEEKFRRQTNLDVVAQEMRMRPVDILESFRRIARHDALLVLESISRGKQRFERYLTRRAAIVKLRREKEAYSFQDLAQELQISEDAVKGHMRDLGKGAKKLFGFTEIRAEHPKKLEQESENIEGKMRAAYTNAVIALHKRGVRHITPKAIADNVQGLQKTPQPWQVEVFLERNPGFIERIIAQKKRQE